MSLVIPLKKHIKNPLYIKFMKKSVWIAYFLLIGCGHQIMSTSNSDLMSSSYASRLPTHIDTMHEKTIYVDPNVHAWGAYNEKGDLIRAGLATAGSNWCTDLGRPCRTKSGTFRIHSLGTHECHSSIFPIPTGGAPMPYCMFFNGSQGLHGSNEVTEGNISHGCVRLTVEDASWIRFNFAQMGTKVIVAPY